MTRHTFLRNALTLGLFTAMALPLGACGNGSQFDVTVGNNPQSYNKGVSGVRQPLSDFTSVRITGSADPVANAVDDEFLDTLTIDFDTTALDTLPRGTALTVSGTAHFTDLQSGGGAQESNITFEPTAGGAHTTAITKIWFARACFCGNLAPSIDQHFSGTITLDDAGSGSLRVRTDLAFDGAIPSVTTSSTHTTIVSDVVAGYPQD